MGRYKRRNSVVESMLFPVKNVSISSLSALSARDSSKPSLDASLHFSSSKVRFNIENDFKTSLLLGETIPLQSSLERVNLQLQKEADFEETISIGEENMSRKRQRRCSAISA